MNKQYTKKQITEAIAYWEKQLKLENYKKVNESNDSTIDAWLKISEYIKTQTKFSHEVYVVVENGVYGWLAVYIDKDKNAFIVRGNHGAGWCQDFLIYKDKAYNIASLGNVRGGVYNYIVNNPHAKEYVYNINDKVIFKMVQTVVDNWLFIKQRLQSNSVSDGRWGIII